MSTMVALAIVVLGIAGILWLALVVLNQPWWPALLFQQQYRPRIVSFSIIALAGILGAISAALLPFEAILPAAVSIWFLFGPMIACRLSAWLAWRRDPVELRSRAAAVRNRRNERLEMAEQVSAEKVWSSYIIDAERAIKQARYRPPS